MGTGPFRFVEHKPDRHVRLARFKDYAAPIDRPLQDQLQEAQTAAVATNRAQGGSVIVLDPSDGDIYAMATEPSFDPNHFAAYGQAGYERAVGIYRWEQVAAATDAVYRSVLARRPQEPAELLR